MFDSYDEWVWKKDFIHKVVFEFNLHLSLCILTSRPFQSYTKQYGIQYITMVGFKSTNLGVYLQSLSTDPNVINSVLDLWNSNRFIREMCKLPLNLVMLISIALNNENLVLNTRTEIYSALIS